MGTAATACFQLKNKSSYADMKLSIRIVHSNSPQSLLDPSGIPYLADGGVVILTGGGKLTFHARSAGGRLDREEVAADGAT